MVAINPMGRGKSNTPLLSQLSFNFDMFTPHWVDINEDERVVNAKRLLKWRSQDDSMDKN